MIIQHNMQAANANRMLGTIVTSQSKSTEKLSSGYRINRAGDDAAGLAISEKMRGQIRGLNKASDNAQDGISMIQTAEGALTETHSIIQRMRELAVQAANDTNTDDDRTQIQNEIDQLTQEVDRIATTTEFNTKKLLDGSRQGSVNEKAGSANVDSTFANSNVSASITTDGSAKAAFDDVIRIEITQDFKAGQSTAAGAKYTNKEIADAFTAGLGNKTVANATAAELAAAKTTVDGALATAKTNLAASEATLEREKEDVASAVKDALIHIQTDPTNFDKETLKTGVTAEQLQKAVDDYIAALGANGGTATGAGVTAAKTAFDALFNVDKGGTGDANTAWKKSLEDAIKAVSTAKEDIVAKEAAYDAAKKNSDIMNNDELVNAYVTKKQAEGALTAATAAGPGSEAEAAAQVTYDNAVKALEEINKGNSVMTVTDLFGNTSDTDKFKISSEVNENNELTINLKNKSGEDTVITISNADKLKAGDVITITSEAMVESKQAATGKEAFRLQVGANAGQEVALGINSMKAKDLNIVQTKDGVEGKSLDITSQANASLAVKAFDMAIQKVSTERAKMGATQNRLEHTIANLDTSSENLQSAESRIRDVDMAEEMVAYSKNSILQQAAQSMLAQANQSTQGVLSLLQ